MNGLQYALSQLHDGETAMVAQLSALADRHPAEHEVRHVALDLADWSRGHATRIKQLADDHSLPVGSAAAERHPGVLRRLSSTLAGLGEQPVEPAAQLLADLQDTYLRAARNSLSWELLAQYAQAARQQDALQLSSACHPQSLRQMRWANTMLKTVSPQVLSSL